ncbi:MAG: hypothetical protein H8D97_01295, partial [Proteobacteria bacterium]|nr:hypothetical protein [Pseudomonadota bacterium]
MAVNQEEVLRRGNEDAAFSPSNARFIAAEEARQQALQQGGPGSLSQDGPNLKPRGLIDTISLGNQALFDIKVILNDISLDLKESLSITMKRNSEEIRNQFQQEIENASSQLWGASEHLAYATRDVSEMQGDKYWARRARRLNELEEIKLDRKITDKAEKMSMMTGEVQVLTRSGRLWINKARTKDERDTIFQTISIDLMRYQFKELISMRRAIGGSDKASVNLTTPIDNELSALTTISESIKELHAVISLPYKGLAMLSAIPAGIFKAWNWWKNLGTITESSEEIMDKSGLKVSDQDAFYKFAGKTFPVLMDKQDQYLSQMNTSLKLIGSVIAGDHPHWGTDVIDKVYNRNLGEIQTEEEFAKFNKEQIEPIIRMQLKQQQEESSGFLGGFFKIEQQQEKLDAAVNETMELFSSTKEQHGREFKTSQERAVSFENKSASEEKRDATEEYDEKTAQKVALATGGAIVTALTGGLAPAIIAGLSGGYFAKSDIEGRDAQLTGSALDTVIGEGKDKELVLERQTNFGSIFRDGFNMKRMRQNNARRLAASKELDKLRGEGEGEGLSIDVRNPNILPSQTEVNPVSEMQIPGLEIPKATSTSLDDVNPISKLPGILEASNKRLIEETMEDKTPALEKIAENSEQLSWYMEKKIVPFFEKISTKFDTLLEYTRRIADKLAPKREVTKKSSEEITVEAIKKAQEQLRKETKLKQSQKEAKERQMKQSESMFSMGGGGILGKKQKEDEKVTKDVFKNKDIVLSRDAQIAAMMSDVEKEEESKESSIELIGPNASKFLEDIVDRATKKREFAAQQQQKEEEIPISEMETTPSFLDSFIDDLVDRKSQAEEMKGMADSIRNMRGVAANDEPVPIAAASDKEVEKPDVISNIVELFPSGPPAAASDKEVEKPDVISNIVELFPSGPPAAADFVKVQAVAAEGGITTGPTLAGEAGQEVIIPLDSPQAEQLLGGETTNQLLKNLVNQSAYYFSKDRKYLSSMSMSLDKMKEGTIKSNEEIKGTFEKYLPLFATGIEEAVDTIPIVGSLVNKVIDWEEGSSKIGNLFDKFRSRVEVPQAAEGGIIPINAHPGEAIIPLDSPQAEQLLGGDTSLGNFIGNAQNNITSLINEVSQIGSNEELVSFIVNRVFSDFGQTLRYADILEEQLMAGDYDQHFSRFFDSTLNTLFNVSSKITNILLDDFKSGKFTDSATSVVDTLLDLTISGTHGLFSSVSGILETGKYNEAIGDAFVTIFDSTISGLTGLGDILLERFEAGEFNESIQKLIGSDVFELYKSASAAMTFAGGEWNTASFGKIAAEVIPLTLQGVVTLFKDVISGFKESGIKGAAKGIFEIKKEGFMAVFDGLGKYSALAGTIGLTIGGPVGMIAGMAVGGLAGALSGWYQSGKPEMIKLTAKVMNPILINIGQILGFVEIGFQKSLDYLGEKFQQLADLPRRLADAVSDRLSDIGTNIRTRVGGIFSIISGNIPQAAEGGITTGPTLAGEAGEEAVLPLTDKSAMTKVSDAIWQGKERIIGSAIGQTAGAVLNDLMANKGDIAAEGVAWKSGGDVISKIAQTTGFTIGKDAITQAAQNSIPAIIFTYGLKGLFAMMKKTKPGEERDPDAKSKTLLKVAAESVGWTGMTFLGLGGIGGALLGGIGAVVISKVLTSLFSKLKGIKPDDKPDAKSAGLISSIAESAGWGSAGALAAAFVPGGGLISGLINSFGAVLLTKVGDTVLTRFKDTKYIGKALSTVEKSVDFLNADISDSLGSVFSGLRKKVQNIESPNNINTSMFSDLREMMPLPKPIPAYEKGGYVPKTGEAIVHKGEYVIPAKYINKKIATQLGELFETGIGNKKESLDEYSIGGFINKTKEAIVDAGEYVLGEDIVSNLRSKIRIKQEQIKEFLGMDDISELFGLDKIVNHLNISDIKKEKLKGLLSGDTTSMIFSSVKDIISKLTSFGIPLNKSEDLNLEEITEMIPFPGLSSVISAMTGWKQTPYRFGGLLTRVNEDQRLSSASANVVSSQIPFFKGITSAIDLLKNTDLFEKINTELTKLLYSSGQKAGLFSDPIPRACGGEVHPLKKAATGANIDNARQAYMVGENEAELLLPEVRGTIVPLKIFQKSLSVLIEIRDILKKKMVIGIPDFAVNMPNILEGFSVNIKNWWESPSGFSFSITSVKGLFDGVFGFFQSTISKLGFDLDITPIREGISSIVSSIGNGISKVWETISDTDMGLKDKLIRLYNLTFDGMSFVFEKLKLDPDIINNIKLGISNITTSISSIFSKENIDILKDKLIWGKLVLQGIYDVAVEKIQGAVTSLKGWWDTNLPIIKEKLIFASMKIQGLFLSGIGKISDYIVSAQEWWTKVDIKGAIGKKLADARDFMFAWYINGMSKVHSFIDGVKEKWSNFKDKITQPFTKAKEFLSKGVSSIKDGIKNLLGFGPQTGDCGTEDKLQKLRRTVCRWIKALFGSIHDSIAKVSPEPEDQGIFSKIAAAFNKAALFKDTTLRGNIIPSIGGKSDNKSKTKVSKVKVVSSVSKLLKTQGKIWLNKAGSPEEQTSIFEAVMIDLTRAMFSEISIIRKYLAVKDKNEGKPEREKFPTHLNNLSFGKTESKVERLEKVKAIKTARLGGEETVGSKLKKLPGFAEGGRPEDDVLAMINAQEKITPPDILDEDLKVQESQETELKGINKVLHKIGKYYTENSPIVKGISKIPELPNQIGKYYKENSPIVKGLMDIKYSSDKQFEISKKIFGPISVTGEFFKEHGELMVTGLQPEEKEKKDRIEERLREIEANDLAIENKDIQEEQTELLRELLKMNGKVNKKGKCEYFLGKLISSVGNILSSASGFLTNMFGKFLPFG